MTGHEAQRKCEIWRSDYNQVRPHSAIGAATARRLAGYDTAWLMAHKLRHRLSERSEYPLDGLIEIDESYYRGRGKPESRGRGLTDPNKSLMAIAVETVPASPRQGEGII